MTAALLTAWCYAGQNDLRRALDTLDRIRDPSSSAFRDYNAGLISELLGNSAEARRRLKSAYEADKNTLRFADAYARFLATYGEIDGAKGIYRDFSDSRSPSPRRRACACRSQCRLRVPDPIIRSAKDGAAEVLYGLGAAGS